MSTVRHYLIGLRNVGLFLLALLFGWIIMIAIGKYLWLFLSGAI